MKAVRSQKMVLLLVLSLLGGCSLSSDRATLYVDLPDDGGVPGLASPGGSLLMSAPADAGAFGCYVVNVSGPGIFPRDGSRYDGSCKFMGAESGFVVSSGNNIELNVRPGKDRQVQVIGAVFNDGVCAAGASMASLNQLSGPGTSPPYQLYELGSTKVDIFGDTSVTVYNSYTSAAPHYPFNCPYNGEVKTSLPLMAGWRDGTSLVGFSGSYAGTATPPAEMGSFVNLTAGEISQLSDPNNVSPVRQLTSTAAFASRIDLLFDVSSVNLADYARLELVVIGSGGTSPYSAGCVNSDPTVGSMEARIATNDSYWYSPVVLAHSVVSSNTHQSVLMESDVSNGNLSMYNYAKAGSVNGNFVHVSIRSNYGTTSGTDCSNISLRHVGVFLRK